MCETISRTLERQITKETQGDILYCDDCFRHVSVEVKFSYEQRCFYDLSVGKFVRGVKDSAINYME
jgi:hypothetical protein